MAKDVSNPDELRRLRAEIAACRTCAEHLAAGPRPIVQFGARARLVIVGQAPGRRVHESGVPWDDDSGERLRAWTGLTAEAFYDADRVALVPMGFCYPGGGPSGDLPPRPECAPKWHARVFDVLPPKRLCLLVGGYAQARYMPQTKRLSLTQRVQSFAEYGPDFFPLPHPSWRSVGWIKRNPWFDEAVLPVLRQAVLKAIRAAPSRGS